MFYGFPISYPLFRPSKSMKVRKSLGWSVWLYGVSTYLSLGSATSSSLLRGCESSVEDHTSYFWECESIMSDYAVDLRARILGNRQP